MVGIAPQGLNNFFFYLVPLLLTILYSITGSDYVLVSWLDEVLIFFIEDWVSNFNMLIVFLSSLFLLHSFFNEKASWSYAWATSTYALQVAFWEYIVIVKSADAIRYIRPSWNK